MLTNRRRVLLLVLVLTMVAAGVLAMALVSWHRAAYDQQRARLVEIVKNQARIIEAVARFDREHSMHVSGEAIEATLGQFRDAHEQFEGFGETGELTLARREGDQIVFLLSHRHGPVDNPPPVPWDGKLAEPMRLALSGKSDIVEDLDYRGAEVLAAHEPVAELGLGIVAKIDLDEVRAPYVRAGLLSAAWALALIASGAVLFMKIANPLVDALEESERLYRGVYSCAPLAFVIWDRQYRVVGWNEQAESIFGWTSEQAIGRDIFDLIIPEEARPQVAQVVGALLEGEVASHSINENVTRDGEIILCEWNNAVLHEADGSVAGAVSLGLDVTERQRSAARLERMAAELADKNRELEQLVYVVSHDLRSPLVNVEGYSGELERVVAELARGLADEGVPARVKAAAAPVLESDVPEALRFIRSGVSKMNALLYGLLKLSRLGRVALTVEYLDMNRLIADVAEQFELRIKEAGATVEITNLPRCRGDAVQLSQVFSNLLENALKYVDPERATLIRISGSAAGDRATYRVEDNGIGIAADQLGKVFEIFHQVDPRTHDGEGLGLTIVQRGLSRLAGKVGVESTPGEGSRFEVSLPVS